jgi:hypothetical protein
MEVSLWGEEAAEECDWFILPSFERDVSTYISLGHGANDDGDDESRYGGNGVCQSHERSWKSGTFHVNIISKSNSTSNSQRASTSEEMWTETGRYKNEKPSLLFLFFFQFR